MGTLKTRRCRNCALADTKHQHANSQLEANHGMWLKDERLMTRRLRWPAWAQPHPTF